MTVREALTQLPPHGTAARRRRGCTCCPCRVAMRDYKRKFEQQGKPYTMPAAAARAHMLRLQAVGLSDRSVGSLAGIGESTARDIRDGSQRRCRTATAEAILGVALDDRAQGQRRMPKAPAVALVERLVACGVKRREIAEALGYAKPYLGFLADRRKLMSPRTWQRIRVVAQLMVRAGRVPADVMEVAS